MRAWLRRIAKLAAAAALAGGLGWGLWRLAGSAGGSEPGGERAALRSVRATVGVRPDSALVRLSVELDGPGTFRRRRVPLLPASVSLLGARLDGRPARLEMAGDRLALDLRGAGRRTAELDYAVPLPAAGRLTLALPRAITTAVELELPEADCAVKVPPPAIVEMLDVQEGTRARIIAPPCDELELAWSLKPPAGAAAVRAAARTETLYTFQGGSLAGRSVYSLRVEGRSVSRLAFAVPEGLTVDNVEGDWVEGWESSGGRLLVQSRAPLAGERELVVHHRRALGAGEADLEVPVLEGAARQWGFGAVAAGGAVEVLDLSLESGAALDVRALPASLRPPGGATVARAFRYDTVPSRRKLKLVRHKEMDTLDATCDSLNALLAYASDGRCVGKAVYTVRNAHRQHLEVRLPEGAALWSAFVARRPVQPSVAEDGRILVPLSCSAETAARGFPVELVYSLSAAAFGHKGGFQATLPSVDLPVMQVMLSVSVPEDVYLEDFSGALKPVESFAFLVEAGDVGVIEEAVRSPADAPRAAQAAEVIRQIRGQEQKGVRDRFKARVSFEDLNRNDAFQRSLRYNPDNAAFLKQYQLEGNNYKLVAQAPAAPAVPQPAGGPTGGAPPPAPPPAEPRINLTGFGQDELAEITGLASLSVAVPGGGRTFRFERRLLIAEPAEVAAAYWSSLAGRPGADQPARLVSSTAARYDFSPHSVRLVAALTFSLQGGKADALAYSLPAGVKVLSVTGENLAGWEAAGGALRLKLVRPERSGGRLLVTGELAGAGGELVLQPLRLAAAAAEEALVAVGAPEDYELAFAEAEKLERLAPRALPAALAGAGERATVFRLPAGGGPAGVRVKAERRRELAALQATCDSVNAISFYTQDGVGVTRVICEVRNAGLRHLELTLPAEARLWGAFVAERAVKPLAGDGGRILLPLEVPQDGQARSFPVEVVYATPGKRFERRGNMAVELPRLNVPVMHAMYSLYLPAGLRVYEAAGSLRRVKSFSAPAAPADGRPTAAVEAFRERYQKRQEELELNVSRKDLQRALGPAGSAPAAPDNGPAACGIKVHIPAVGQILRFERRLVLEGKLSVSFPYRN